MNQFKYHKNQTLKGDGTSNEKKKKNKCFLHWLVSVYSVSFLHLVYEVYFLVGIVDSPLWRAGKLEPIFTENNVLVR